MMMTRAGHLPGLAVLVGMTPRSLAGAIGRISDLASAGGRAEPVCVLRPARGGAGRRGLVRRGR